MATIRPQRGAIEEIIPSERSVKLESCTRFSPQRVQFELGGSRVHLLGMSRPTGLMGSNQKIVAVFGRRKPSRKISSEDWQALRDAHAAVLLSRFKKKVMESVRLLASVRASKKGSKFRFKETNKVAFYPRLVTG